MPLAKRPQAKVVAFPSPDRPDVQQLLLHWHRTGDVAAQTRALCQLQREWRGRIIAFLRDPNEAEVWLQDALIDLCIVGRNPGRRATELTDTSLPRVVAPEGHDAAAWRGRVLRNWLISRWRRVARERRRRVAWDAHGVELAASRPARSQELWHSDASAARLQEALDELPVKPRALVMLRFGFPLDPILEELAEALDEPVADVAARLGEARRDPTGRRGSLFTHAELRVVYPDGALSTRRDTARKALDRAMRTLRTRLSEVLHDPA